MSVYDLILARSVGPVDTKLAWTLLSCGFIHNHMDIGKSKGRSKSSESAEFWKLVLSQRLVLESQLLNLFHVCVTKGWQQT